jgi:hypothetical protein
VRLDLDQESHHELRMAAARRSLSMAEFARQAVVSAARKLNKDGDK